MTVIQRGTPVVAGSYTSGAGATTTTASYTGGRGGDIAIAIVSATGTARSDAAPLSVSAGWNKKYQTPNDYGPNTGVYTRRLAADGTVSITATCPTADSGIQIALWVGAGATEDIVVTPATATAGSYSRTAATKTQAVTAPTASIAVGQMAITWHAPFYLSGGTTTWSTTRPTNWYPASANYDTVICGLGTYAAATAAGNTGAQTATLSSAARNWIALTIVIPTDDALPTVQHVATTTVTPAVKGVWVPKPAGAAADDEASTFNFVGQSTARQRVLISRFKNVHPTNPFMSTASALVTFGANTATASTTMTAPSVDWSPRSMMLSSFTVGATPNANGWTTPTGMTGAGLTGTYELANYYQAFSGTALSSGTRVATFGASSSSVWNAGSLVLRAADDAASAVEILIAWHSMDASQSYSTMDTPGWGGWTLLGTMQRVSSSGAANYKVYYQIVDPILHEQTWTADTDPMLLGNNEDTNPCCLVDATNWAPFSPGDSTGARVTDITGMSRSTGYRCTRTTAGNGYLGAWCSQMLSCSPGEVISVSADIKSNSLATTFSTIVGWYDSSSAFISYGVSQSLFPQIGVAVRPTSVMTAPANAAQFRVLAYVPDVPQNATLDVTAVRVRRGNYPYLPYLDGETFRCMWNGTRGASASQRNLTTYPDQSGATVGTSIGFEGTQRQDGTQTYVSGPAALPVESAPFGRPGLAVRADIPAPPYMRVEHNPAHRQFIHGDDYWFGFSFALPLGFPTWVQDFWVIEQLHGGPGSGSPVVSFETREYALRLRGGDGKPGASPSTQYAYAITLMNNLKVGRWYDVIYHVVFSNQNAGGSVDVWVDGIQRLSGYAPPGSTVYDSTSTPSASDSGPTYRKCGAYKRYSIEGGGSGGPVDGGQPYHAGVALGRSYAGVNPSRPQVPATSPFIPQAVF